MSRVLDWYIKRTTLIIENITALGRIEGAANLGGIMITNVVCKANLNVRIDLRTLTNESVNIVYNPSRFSGVRWKHPKIGGHCMVFSSGYIPVNGKVTYIREGKRRLRRYARLLQRLGWEVRLTVIDVVTVSASFKLDGPIDLIKVAPYYSGRYDPELFPAVMFTNILRVFIPVPS